jgi:hypothetical protein
MTTVTRWSFRESVVEECCRLQLQQPSLPPLAGPVHTPHIKAASSLSRADCNDCALLVQICCGRMWSSSDRLRIWWRPFEHSTPPSLQPLGT